MVLIYISLMISDVEASTVGSVGARPRGKLLVTEAWVWLQSFHPKQWGPNNSFDGMLVFVKSEYF